MKKTFLYVIVLSFILSYIFSKTADKATCFNPETNEEVDYYVIYFLRGGKSYAYFDNNTKPKIYSIEKNDFPPLQMSLALNSNKNNYIVWNDQALEGLPDMSTTAHSKGIIAYNKTKAYYLNHSLPKFPGVMADGKFSSDLPSNSGVYTQTFFCFSMSLEDVQVLLTEMKDVKPGIQKSKINLKSNSELDKAMLDLIQNKSRLKNPEMDVVKVNDFFAFLKPYSLSVMPWDYISDYFKEDFTVATWTKPELIPNNCKEKYKTLNALEYNILGNKYSNTQDHSKWAFSKSYVCFGDINRTESQLKRGGMIICLKSVEKASYVKPFVTSYEKCENLKFLN